MRLLAVLVTIICSLPAQGRLLDPDSPANTLLDPLTPLLDQYDIDTARNLNANAAKPGRRPQRPRLGMLADLPAGKLADADELLGWEKSYLAGEIAAIAALPAEPGNDRPFAQRWMDTPPLQRALVSLAAADQAPADAVAAVLDAAGYAVRRYPGESGAAGDTAPRLYATAGQRLVLDSRRARKAKSAALEMRLLGRRLYRATESVYPASGRSSRYYARGEPRRFRKAELGNEQVAATIPEIIVSGGIALGEKASFQHTPKAIEFTRDHRFRLLLQDGTARLFEDSNPLTLKVCFDFATRSLVTGSDAIIDIDEKHRVKLSAVFRNTDIGYLLIGIDEQPFRYVRNLSAIKSIIIDTAVQVLSPTAAAAGFSTGYEVRFINPDRRKLAETRVALVYRYDSTTRQASYVDSWGPRAFRVNNADLAALGQATSKAAELAGWIALFRAVESGPVDFSHGRYEFLKIDTASTRTPRSSRGG